MDCLTASAGYGLGFGSGEEPGRKATTSEAWVHPEALQFATVAPGPSANAGDDRASVANEDRQLYFITEPMAADASRRICASRNSMSNGSGWSSTWKSTVTGVSDVDHLLNQRDVIEVRPI